MSTPPPPSPPFDEPPAHTTHWAVRMASGRTKWGLTERDAHLVEAANLGSYMFTYNSFPMPSGEISQDEHEANWSAQFAEMAESMGFTKPDPDHRHIANDPLPPVVEDITEQSRAASVLAGLDSLRGAAEAAADECDGMCEEELEEHAAEESRLPVNSPEWRELMFRPGMAAAMMFVLYEVVHQAHEYKSKLALVRDLQSWKDMTFPQREALIGLFVWIETQIVSDNSSIPEDLRQELMLAFKSYEHHEEDS